MKMTGMVRRLGGPDDNSKIELQDPTWEEVDAAIRALDADSRSLVILGIGTPVPHMGIGGGSGRYIVYETSDNLNFFNLISRKPSDGKTYLVAGGQEGVYDKRLIVSVEETITAARTYFLSGKRDSSLNWEEQQ